MKIMPYDIVDATFAPKDTADIKAQCLPFIGWRGPWMAMWRNEDFEHYPGQCAMRMWFEPDDSDAHDPEKNMFLWVPECDLEVHGMIYECQWIREEDEDEASDAPADASEC